MTATSTSPESIPDCLTHEASVLVLGDRVFEEAKVAHVRESVSN
jgi:hypothetical protein